MRECACIKKRSTTGIKKPRLFLPNVKVMATPLAGASVERGDEVEIPVKHREQRG